jgi:DNA-binding NtrC family response regulator
MNKSKILLVENEADTLLNSLESLKQLDVNVTVAIEVSKAILLLKEKAFDLMLFNLEIPSENRIELLRQALIWHPDLKIIVIDFNITIDLAISLMKLGVMDIITHQIKASQLKELIEIILKEDIHHHSVLDYESYLKLAQYWGKKKQLNSAIELAKEAIGIDPSRPEAFTILGELQEKNNNITDALKNYRVAIAIDPTYKNARDKLEKATTRHIKIHKHHLI